MILGGHSTFFATLNSFVHIVMYFYYMVAAMGPQYQKFIWWKKYLTTFQMVSINTNFITNFSSNHYYNSFRFNSLPFLRINSNCCSATATTRRVSWYGSVCTVSCSCSCFPTSTSPSTRL